MSESPDKWRGVDTNQIADCRVFTVHEKRMTRPDDEIPSSFFVIDAPDWANIIALTDNNEIVLIEQFRIGLDDTTLEIPGGMVDKDEEPIAAAGRELEEETGYIAGHIEPLGYSVPNPAIQTNKMYHFLATGCTDKGTVNFDEHESIKTKTVPLAEARELIKNGAISHSLVLAAFLKFEYYRAGQSKYKYES